MRAAGGLAASLALAGALVWGGPLAARPQDPPANAPSRDQRWKEDLRHLCSELPKLHKNLFFRLPRGEFEAEATRLEGGIPGLSDAEVAVALARLVARVGDSHTSVALLAPGVGLRAYPLALRWFPEGLVVLAAPEAHRAALRGRVTRIGDLEASEARDRLAQVIPHENGSWLLHQSPNYLICPEILRALGVWSGEGEVPFVVEGPSGGQLTLRLEPVPLGSSPPVAQALDTRAASLPPTFRNPRLLYFAEFLAESGTYYVAYRQCANRPDKPFADFAREVLAFVAANPVERLVLDLRANSGGDSEVARPLLAGLPGHEKLDARGRLFVLIGRRTFSSGVLNALELRRTTAALLAGEPTGGKPNSYGEVRTFKLPRSGLVVSYSTKFFRRVEGDPESLAPDLPVEMTAADLFAFRDPVLDAVIAWKPPAAGK
ncbi:MAG: S41 family peptidase [Planctomycetales bacterium]|nr:S41 family peptidase [Planctomycetales bacterium]